MEKIIIIAGKAVPFKTNGTALLQYKMQFGRDLIPDILKIVNDGALKNAQSGGALSMDRLDAETIFAISWTFARIADKSIPPMLEWLEGFENVPLLDLFTGVLPLLMECITSTAQAKKAVAAAGYQQITKHSGRSGFFSSLRKRA